MKRAAAVVLAVVFVGVTCTAREIVVTSTADRGAGTLRLALQTAQSGDTITFDSNVFPPDDPATIRVTHVLPSLTQGDLTIDASDAGVILDGQQISEPDVWGLEILSNGNTIQGLQIVNFTGRGIEVVGGAQHNVLGGSRTIGSGPLGQGNLCSGNNGGIGLSDRGTSYNTITGNLVGTDITGSEPFANIDGVFISGGASHNTIGPGNTIAYNHERAIVIQGPETLANRITRNSIHDNAWGGIQLLDGGNSDLEPPFIMRFGHSAGDILGSSHPHAVIEFFSDDADQGKTYEGQTTTDDMGAFAFAKGSSFSGLHVTATCTDAEGNTSVFSLPTIGASQSALFQPGNLLPPRHLSPLTSDVLADNRIADMYSLCLEAPSGIVHSVSPTGFASLMNEVGLKWMRVSLDYFDWNEVGSDGPFSSHRVDSRQDQAVSALVEHGIDVMCTLVYWDKEMVAHLEDDGYSRFQDEDEIQRFLDYVRSVVQHFRGRIRYYELLNEPNVTGAGQYVEVSDYINLALRVIPVVRQEDPAARLVVGAITPLLDLDGYNYLFSILNSDIMPLIDGVSWHVGAPAPDYEYWRDYFHEYPSIVQEIKKVASTNGFRGEYMAEELQWRTEKSAVDFEPWVYGTREAAKYLARGIVMHLGLDVTAGIADHLEAPKMEVVRALCTVMAGHVAIDMPLSIDIETDGPVAYCAFRYPNGDRMLAVWTDGIAQDEDPGIPTTITFPGLTAETVTGIDVLHGFEQELVFETDGNDTVVRDLLVKDYPILIRLSDVTMGPDYEETVGDGFHRLGEPGGA